MSNVYKYTWKDGITIFSKHQIEFPQPLLDGMIFVDLLTGKTYRVNALYKAKEFDRAGPGMAEDVVHTFPFESLSEEQLIAVRKKYKFEVYEGLAPKEQFAILD
jgi:hypothetical protein